MRTVVTFAACLVLAACSRNGGAPAAPAGPPAGAPQGKAGTPLALEHDFGVIPHGEKREHEFTVDVGSLGEPYVPLRVHLDCSCGLAELRLRHRDGSERVVDGRPVAELVPGPEERLVARVVIDTNGKEALDLPKTTSRGFIVLQALGDPSGNTRIQWPILLRFGIEAPVELRPFAALDFGRVPVSGTAEILTTLRGDERHPGVRFGPVESTDPHVTATLELEGDRTVVRARCRPGDLGNHRAIVAIGTDLPGYRVHLAATWKVVPDLEATPLAKVSFRADVKKEQTAAQAAGQFVLVVDHDERRPPEFALHEIVDADGRDVRKSFEVTLAPVPGQARQRRLLVRYLGGLEGTFRGTLVLTKHGADGPFLPIELVVFASKS